MPSNALNTIAEYPIKQRIGRTVKASTLPTLANGGHQVGVDCQNLGPPLAVGWQWIWSTHRPRVDQPVGWCRSLELAGDTAWKIMRVLQRSKLDDSRLEVSGNQGTLNILPRPSDMTLRISFCLGE